MAESSRAMSSDDMICVSFQAAKVALANVAADFAKEFSGFPDARFCSDVLRFCAETVLRRKKVIKAIPGPRHLCTVPLMKLTTP